MLFGQVNDGPASKGIFPLTPKHVASNDHCVKFCCAPVCLSYVWTLKPGFRKFAYSSTCTIVTL